MEMEPTGRSEGILPGKETGSIPRSSTKRRAAAMRPFFCARALRQVPSKFRAFFSSGQKAWTASVTDGTEIPRQAVP